jgi:hypothetical protein
MIHNRITHPFTHFQSFTYCPHHTPSYSLTTTSLFLCPSSFILLASIFQHPIPHSSPDSNLPTIAPITPNWPSHPIDQNQTMPRHTRASPPPTPSPILPPLPTPGPVPTPDSHLPPAFMTTIPLSPMHSPRNSSAPPTVQPTPNLRGGSGCCCCGGDEPGFCCGWYVDLSL